MLRREDTLQTQCRGFTQQRYRQIFIPVLNLLHMRSNFFVEEITRCACNCEVLRGKIFRSEDVRGERLFNQK